MAMYKNGQRVKVAKMFHEEGTPCPEVGTEGRVIIQDTEWVRVAFEYPFVDREGCIREGEDTKVICFKPDEIGMVNDG